MEYGVKPFKIRPINLWEEPKKKERIKLTAVQRIYIWEHPKKYGRTCIICHKKITKLSELELDHAKPYSKGGTKLALAHRDCNRMKASGSLRKIQKTLGIRTTKKRTAGKRKIKKKKEYDVFGFPKLKVSKLDFGI